MSTCQCAYGPLIVRTFQFSIGRPGRSDYHRPESGIHRSADAGRTWTKLGGGLPTGPIGRSNIDIAPSRPQTVYVYLDNRAPVTGGPAGRTYVGGEVYRSDDRGNTWRKANTGDIYQVFGIFGWKFCDIRVSPDNAEEIYIFGNRAFHSTDGGRTYARIGETIRRLRDTQGLAMHLDHHEFWIDPADPNHHDPGCRWRGREDD